MRHCRKLLLIAVVLCLVPGCSLLQAERVLLDRGGVRVAVEPDPSLRRAASPVANNHPASLSAEDVRLLLEPLQVSGWSGTLVGLLEQPRAVPVFSQAELEAIAGPIADGLKDAGRGERIAFQLIGTRKGASDDRIAGALFLRGRYLHVVLQDHAEFARADTGGGEERDVRDNKGMKLWVNRPAAAAMVPDAEEPRWAPFERVHLSVTVADVLASAKRPPAAGGATSVGDGPSAGLPPGSPVTAGESLQPRQQTDELSLQIQELTHSNLDLRRLVEEQRKMIEALKEDVTKLRQELDRKAPRGKSPNKPTGP